MAAASLQNDGEDGDASRVSTFARVRPPLPRELKNGEFVRCLGVPRPTAADAYPRSLFVTTSDAPVLLDAAGGVPDEVDMARAEELIDSELLPMQRELGVVLANISHDVGGGGGD